MKRFVIKHIVPTLICMLILVGLIFGMGSPTPDKPDKGAKPMYSAYNNRCYRINRAGERIPVRRNIRSSRALIAVSGNPAR